MHILAEEKRDRVYRTQLRRHNAKNYDDKGIDTSSPVLSNERLSSE